MPRLQNGRSPLFIILCCLLQVCVLVDGLYQLEVTVFGYDNPTGRCQECREDETQGCCDDFESTSCSGSELCDSFFTYCLRTNGSTGRGCSYLGNQISGVNSDDGPLNFSQSTVLGLTNPIVLQGLTNAYTGVQLYIEIIDSDSSGSDDLIDVLLIDHDLPIGQPSSRQNYSGIFDFKFVMMDLSITARCVENFQGPNCSQCLPDFAGTMCNVSINDCIGVNCSGNGQCVDGVLSYTCDCDPGFTGVECDVNINDCAGIDCSGNGVCVDGVNSFICQCSSGFMGDLCQINTDDCAGVNCSGNGVCLDGVNSFTCRCNPGFSGTICMEEVEISGGSAISKSLVYILGGTLGGAISIIIFLVLVITLLIIIKCKARQKLTPQVDTTLSNDEELVDNEMYDFSLPITYYTVPDEPQMQNMSTQMKRNVCYVPTLEHAHRAQDC